MKQCTNRLLTWVHVQADVGGERQAVPQVRGGGGVAGPLGFFQGELPKKLAIMLVGKHADPVRWPEVHTHPQ